MKRLYCLKGSFVLLIVCFLASNVFAEKELYDDFSGTYIDSKRWDSRELVREVVGGKLVSKLGNASGTGFFDNNTSFQDPASINTIESEITLVVTNLDTGNGPMSFARIGGYFYNTQTSGGATGDIWAAVFIGDRGSGLEAFWEVEEALDDDLTNFELKGSGTLVGPGTLTHGIPYTVKLDYDGNTGFEFTVAGVNESFVGPASLRAAVTRFKALITGVDADGGSGTGYVYALFDDVYINNEATAYDTFTTAPLDPAKWKTLERVREIAGGKLRLNVQAEGSMSDAGSNTKNDSAAAAYLEAKVLIETGSYASSGASAHVRLASWYYNDSRGPGSGLPYNGYEGNVFIRNRIILDDTSNLRAEYSIRRCNGPDPEVASWTVLSLSVFAIQINFDTEYTLSTEFTGSRFIFKCNDETYQYDVTGPMYPPYEGRHPHLKSRIDADTGESGYVKAQFDDIYVAAVDRGDELTVDFSTNGLWHYDGSSWTNLAGWNPESMVEWDSALAVDFGTYGLWNYDGSSWTSLAGWNPESLIQWDNGLAVDFGSYGLWHYNGSSWASLAGWNPESLIQWDFGLAVDFGSYGLWHYYGTSWMSLAGWNPDSMVKWDSGIAVDFGTYGLWHYDWSGWKNLASWNPEDMEVWGFGLVVDFGAYGLWKYDGSSWSNLAGWDSGGMEAYGAGLSVDFGTYGLWYYDGSSWTSLAGWNPDGMETWGSGLAVDFGTYGLWNHDGSTWTSLASWDPEDMIDVDLY